MFIESSWALVMQTCLEYMSLHLENVNCQLKAKAHVYPCAYMKGWFWFSRLSTMFLN